MRVVLGVGLLTMLLVAANGWSQPDIAGEVIAIADGDTFRLLTPAKKQVKIRLAEIDTPERGQPYSNRAREVLAALVNGAAGHALDFDDTHTAMGGHPSVPVLPALLALAVTVSSCVPLPAFPARPFQKVQE